ncbi:MAG: putative zinc-binding protein [Candidatus Hodarchaeota archaeon]
MNPMTTTRKKVIIIPCSGIGKAFGSIGREATYIVTEELRPNETNTLCLSLLTMGDKESQQAVQEQLTISVDGCPKKCSQVNIEKSGGSPAVTLRVVDTFRKNKELKPGDVDNIGENGLKLARILAEEISNEVDNLLLNENQKE